MSLETDLVTTLKTVCPRVFPDFAPTDTVKPYITYQQIGGAAPSFIEGALPSIRNARMQVNVWAATRSEATALMLLVESSLVATKTALPESALIAANDDDLGVRGCMQDFSIWADR